MNRQLLLIVGGALGAFLIAMVGVSAHTGGLPILNLAGVHQTHSGDTASGARTEPSDSPEASPNSEPTEMSEPTPTAKPTSEPTETPDEDDMPRATSSPMSSSDEGGGGSGD